MNTFMFVCTQISLKAKKRLLNVLRFKNKAYSLKQIIKFTDENHEYC